MRAEPAVGHLPAAASLTHIPLWFSVGNGPVTGARDHPADRPPRDRLVTRMGRHRYVNRALEWVTGFAG
jgi:hypothetical protein